MLDKSNSDSRTKALSHWSKVRDAVFGQNQDLVERIKSFPLNPLAWRAQSKHKEPFVLQHGMYDVLFFKLFNLFRTSAPTLFQCFIVFFITFCGKVEGIEKKASSDIEWVY